MIRIANGLNALVPSSKSTELWKITILVLMGKSTISMAIFQFAMLTNYQRVNPIKSHKQFIFLWFSYGFQHPFRFAWHPLRSSPVLARTAVARAPEDGGHDMFRQSHVCQIEIDWDSEMNWLVVSTPLKNMKVNWDDENPYGKIQVMFQSPPTSDLQSHNYLRWSNICIKQSKICWMIYKDNVRWSYIHHVGQWQQT